jgi:DNA-binding NarL/FixJ family response regulator
MTKATRRISVRIHGNTDVIAPVLGGDKAIVDADADADVVVVELPEMIDDVALELLAGARSDSDAPAVAIVNGALNPRQARALAAAAEGIVERRCLDQALRPTVAAVVAGQAAIPAWMHRALERPPLSNREKQILAMVVLGFSNAEIASRLVVTESTVKNHLSSAFAKMGVRSRAAATSLILDPATGLGLGVLQLSSAHDT